jgi:2-pyrone-4,6-dicarboxylate lactonase
MLDAMGMTYGVLTQVSVHGTDNRLLAETLRTSKRRLRGIAVSSRTPATPREAARFVSD